MVLIDSFSRWNFLIFKFFKNYFRENVYFEYNLEKKSSCESSRKQEKTFAS
jgi:hypothetical protein